MQKKIELTAIIPNEMAGRRIDQAMAQLFPDYSRMQLKNWLKDKQISISGKTPKPSEKVKGGEEIIIQATLEEQTVWHAEEIPLEILYEDEQILIINKPPGLVVHPAAGNWQGTLLNALLHHCPDLQQLPRAGIIHRLDKDTSGIMVVTKTLIAHTKLSRQMEKREIKREYQAIVKGTIVSGSTINQPIGRHPIQRKKMAVISSGKSAITHYRVLERFLRYTHVKVQLETGRTHQIRVHMTYIQHPIVGDGVYGGRLAIPSKIGDALRQQLQQFKRQALHAWQLGLSHPETNEYMQWQAPLPEDMNLLLDALRDDQKTE